MTQPGERVEDVADLPYWDPGHELPRGFSTLDWRARLGVVSPLLALFAAVGLLATGLSWGHALCAAAMVFLGLCALHIPGHWARRAARSAMEAYPDAGQDLAAVDELYTRAVRRSAFWLTRHELIEELFLLRGLYRPASDLVKLASLLALSERSRRAPERWERVAQSMIFSLLLAGEVEDAERWMGSGALRGPPWFWSEVVLALRSGASREQLERLEPRLAQTWMALDVRNMELMGRQYAAVWALVRHRAGLSIDEQRAHFAGASGELVPAMYSSWPEFSAFVEECLRVAPEPGADPAAQ